MKNVQSKRILLMTSAPPAQSPFSTSEKRPPIGIGFLISVLRRAGHQVSFIDNYLSPVDFISNNYLESNRIDYIGIYANTICFPYTLKILNILQQLRDQGVWKGKIILGGPHTTVCLDTIPDFVDFIVQGEGERAILDIVEEKTTAKIVNCPRVENLDELPSPAWDCFIDKPYNWSMPFIDETPVFTMNTSRGCPFNCTFCSVNSIWGKKYTYFSAKRVVDEIEYLIKTYGAKGIYFREDNFTLHHQRLTEFCRLIIDRNIKIKWACESRVSNLNHEIVSLMAQAGCVGFYFGVESGSQNLLDRLRKGITVEQIRSAFAICRDLNVKTAASIITGIPGETDEDVRLTSSLLDEIKPDKIWYNVFVGIPDSELYQSVLKQRCYEFIDPRNLLYLTGHDQRAKTVYGNGPFARSAMIPRTNLHNDTEKNIKISALLCVHNCQNYIKQALQSIYNQSFQDFELIIVDDASTDSTPDIIWEFKDSRTSIYRNHKNLGLTKSLNIGLAFCSGQYIARMDADDICDPQRLAKQVGFLDSNPDIVAVGSWVNRIDETGTFINSWNPASSPDAIAKRLLIANCIAHGSAMTRKSDLQRVGGYDETFTYAQDYDLWLRLSETSKLANIQEALYSLRTCKTSISSTKKSQQDAFAALALVNALKRRNLLPSGQNTVPAPQPTVPSSQPIISNPNKLSVVLTTFSHPSLLPQVLEGFAAQTAPKDSFEIVLVDDGSTPPAKDIAQSFADKVNINYIYQQNSGLAAARNTGIAAAQGDIILFHDDDDMPGPDLIAEHIKSHQQNPAENVAVLGHLDWHPSLTVTPLMHYVTGPGGQYFGFTHISDGQFYEPWKWWGGLISAKKSLLAKLNGPFDPIFRFGHEDTELVCRLLDRDIKILYNANAKKTILRPIDFETFCNRRIKQGRAIYHLAAKFPAIILARYQLFQAADEYKKLYASNLDKWRLLVLKYLPQINANPAPFINGTDPAAESIYKIWAQCFHGYFIKGYLEEMQAARQFSTLMNTPADLSAAVDASPTQINKTQSRKLPPMPDEPANLPLPRSVTNVPSGRIIFISDYIPDDKRGSSNLRVTNILRILLAAGHKITYLYCGQTSNTEQYLQSFAPDDISFRCIDNDAEKLFNYLETENLSPDYIWFTNLWHYDYLAWAANVAKSIKARCPETFVIADTMDFHYKKFIRKFEHSRDPNDLCLARKFLQAETDLYRASDRIVVVTQPERVNILEVLPTCSIDVIPNIHQPLTSMPPFTERRDICFIGSCYTNHNRDAVEWFIRDIFPHIRSTHPNIEFHILGFDNQHLKAIFETQLGIKVIGTVENAEQTLSQYALMVCPMLYGAGMKGKIGSAASAATPFVTTSIGAEGFGFVDSADCFIADEAVDFASKCLTLLSDPVRWNDFSTRIHSLFAQKYSPKALTPHVLAVLAHAANSQLSPAPSIAAPQKLSAALDRACDTLRPAKSSQNEFIGPAAKGCF